MDLTQKQKEKRPGPQKEERTVAEPSNSERKRYYATEGNERETSFRTKRVWIKQGESRHIMQQEYNSRYTTGDV